MFRLRREDWLAGLASPRCTNAISGMVLVGYGVFKEWVPCKAAQARGCSSVPNWSCIGLYLICCYGVIVAGYDTDMLV